jgi:hypothetical protein
MMLYWLNADGRLLITHFGFNLINPNHKGHKVRTEVPSKLRRDAFVSFVVKGILVEC